MRKTIGETRTTKGFLFLPKIINNEFRWLEFSTWVEQVDNNFKWYGVIWISE